MTDVPSLSGSGSVLLVPWATGVTSVSESSRSSSAGCGHHWPAGAPGTGGSTPGSGGAANNGGAPGPFLAPPTARCTVIAGPVTAGTVSGRQKIAPGRVRVFVQSYASNSAPAAYQVELGTWGRTCRGVNP